MRVGLGLVALAVELTGAGQFEPSLEVFGSSDAGAGNRMEKQPT